MLDEFTSIGKLEIFEKALAFMGGYGIKAFLIVQDLMQLQQAYGPKNAIVSNCHLRIAHAPNNVETAQLLSRMAGETTIVQRKRSRSGKAGDAIGSVSDSLARPAAGDGGRMLRLPGPRKGAADIVAPGEILIFPAGGNPVRGQVLFFQDKASAFAACAAGDGRPARRRDPPRPRVPPIRIGSANPGECTRIGGETDATVRQEADDHPSVRRAAIGDGRSRRRRGDGRLPGDRFEEEDALDSLFDAEEKRGPPMTETILRQQVADIVPSRTERQPGLALGARRAARPFNPVSGRPYRGINSWWLDLQNHQDPRWMTSARPGSWAHPSARARRLPVEY